MTQWKMDDMFCRRVCLNGAETDLLKMTHTLLNKCAQKAAQECGKSVIDITEIDCVNMFLPIQWYWLLQNEINKNYPAIKDKCTCQEILEMTKIWILQFIYRTTCTRIFSELEWYGMGQHVDLTLDRYKSLMRKLGMGEPEIDMSPFDDNDLEKVQTTWSNFNQHNYMILEMKRLFAKCGKNFSLKA